MNTTIKELKNIVREEEKYYFKKKDSVIYNEKKYYFYILVDWKNYISTNNYSSSGIYQKERQMIYFLDYLESNKIIPINKLTKEDVLNYINTFEKYYRKSTIKNYFKELRVILKFLHNYNYISKNLSIFVPNIKTSKNSNIPSYWTEEEIKKIFAQIDISSKNGKRLYLVLLLAFRYGLRCGDIKKLKFSNLNWNTRRINIIQNKTKKEISLPMNLEFISALSDYLKNERPQSDLDTIILSRKNNMPLGKSYNFHYEIKALLKRANIIHGKNKKIGIHSMRHTLASSLLKENIPLPIISTILGHSNTSSTTNYLKIDKEKLLKCCLSLEEVQING